MNLNDLITLAVKRFPQDSWTAEVMLVFETEGQRAAEPLVGIGIIPDGDTFKISLVGISEVARFQKKTGHLPKIGESLLGQENQAVPEDYEI